ncbi:uncharacterized protein, partial [Choristoneura fumiferana]|uniref:uncharacterized protein n=1 Tax=Choristoneura fumiferana TaxID=7141 RepID=UPI003D15758C
MAKNVGSVTCFDVDNGNWQTYSDRLDMYFLVNKVEVDLQLPTLISVIGDSAYELMVNLCSPKKPCECTYKEVMKLMSDYLQPKPSIVAERFKFRQCRQANGQSILSFAANLKKLSKFCDFGSNLDDNMRDQFVCGIGSDLVRQRLFAEDKLTYNKAITTATTLEAAERDSRAVNNINELDGAGSSGRRETTGNVFKIQSTSFGCRACGDTGHITNECKFKKYICDYCREEGHLRRVCPLTAGRAPPGGYYRHEELFDESLAVTRVGARRCACARGDAGVLRARPLPYALRARVDAELDAMLATGVVEPVDHSDWATPLVIARKADGDKEGLSVDPDKIKPILDMQPPKNISELRSFLGMVNFYGKFVKNLSSHLGPLYDLLKKGTYWCWDNARELAFKRVKSLLTSTNVLVHFDVGLPSVVTCDASAHGLGAVLAQRAPDGSERVVAFAS